MQSQRFYILLITNMLYKVNHDIEIGQNNYPPSLPLLPECR